MRTAIGTLGFVIAAAAPVAAAPAPAPSATRITLGTVEVPGGAVTRVEQRVDGLVVYGRELRVLTSASGQVLATRGNPVGVPVRRSAVRFAMDEREAIARATSAIHRTAVDAHAIGVLERRADGSQLFAGGDGAIEVIEARTSPAWFPLPTGELELAWVVETLSRGPLANHDQGWRTIVADDGRVLQQENLIYNEAVTYRAFVRGTDNHPDSGPTEDWLPTATTPTSPTLPTLRAPTLVTVNGGLNHPAGGATPDPWLGDGATQSKGNNVDAYADVFDPTGFSTGDFRATASAAHTFDYAFDSAGEPLASTHQSMASITSLFYALNWLHDFWYDAGFTEAAGNAQLNNFGRGGVGNDAMRGEAQDGAYLGTRDNANAFAPADGMQPRIQMYLWSGAVRSGSLEIVGGAPITHADSQFGPRTFEVTAAGVIAAACVDAPAGVAGKVVLVPEGTTCSAEQQALDLQHGGAVAMIIGDNDETITTLPKDPTVVGNDVTILVTTIKHSAATTLQTAIAAGPTQLHFAQVATPELDGAVSGDVMIHEHGHFVHLRLSPCDGLAVCFGLSEGWADFQALLVQSTPGDDLDGLYPMAVYPDYAVEQHSGYFGIRRIPYSTDLSKDPLTFEDMAQSTPVPTAAPYRANPSPNSEAHNAGEVWTTVMWEVYVALQKAHPERSFDENRALMAKYMVAGLMMTPSGSTPLEYRDGLLTAIRAASATDATTAAAAFAKRGFGACAVGPRFRTSGSLDGSTNDSSTRGSAVIGTPTVAVDGCDDDLLLDVGETAHVIVPVSNGGFEPLTNVALGFESTTAGLALTAEPQTLATLAPGETQMVTFELALDHADANSVGHVVITATTAAGCAPTVTYDLVLALEADVAFGSSATDSFDVKTSWTPDLAWTQESESETDSLWHGVDSAGPEDMALTSPGMTGDASTPVVVTFQHAYQFDQAYGVSWDGGVVEVSIANGPWVDASTLTTAAFGYGPQKLRSDANNPLAGRKAFQSTSRLFPQLVEAKLDFGTMLAGKAFRIRFRIGAGADGIGGGGWNIDDLKIDGITNTPFGARVADATQCERGGDDAGDGDGGGCCQTGSTSPAGAFALGLIGLAVVTRRRRHSR